jgi:hypothetical protein
MAHLSAPNECSLPATVEGGDDAEAFLGAVMR